MSKSRITSSIIKDVFSYQSLSSQSLSTVIKLYTFILTSVFITINTSVDFQSSSRSFTQTFQSLFLQNESFFDSKNDSKKSNRVQSLVYKNELQSHYVYINSYKNLILESVRIFAQNLF